MNPIRILCLVACLVATVCANSKQMPMRGQNSLKPSNWLSASKLDSLTSLDDVTWRQLESMPAEKGAELMQELYHLSQIKNDIAPTFVPSPSNIPAIIVKPNGEKKSITLNQLVSTVKQQPNFGDEEVTIFMTGLPSDSKAITKANKKLVEAYQKRYNGQQQQQQQRKSNKDSRDKTSSSSEEDYDDAEWNARKANRGNLVIIDLGSTLTSFKRFAMLDVEQTGEMIGKVLVQLTNQADIPQEIIHIVAQGIAAPVAGAAGRQYTRLTGHQLRRITALDPSKVFAKNPKVLTGLARGDAKFVDAIHTSVYGMGTLSRVGDVDFFPNGPSAAVPGADNIIKASMRATRYFAESLIPGNERDFPAVAARSLEEYKNKDGYGKRAYMGIKADFDLEGDYMLQVNSKAPFAKSAPAQKQNTYHGVHQPWKKDQDYA